MNSCVHFVKSFYFDACKLLNVNAFVFMYDKFEPNVHCYTNTLKIVNKPRLDYCSRKAVFHFLKKFLNDRYPRIDFDLYLSSRAQNVHMGLNHSLLTLHEYEQIISDIEELWLRKDII